MEKAENNLFPRYFIFLIFSIQPFEIANLENLLPFLYFAFKIVVCVRRDVRRLERSSRARQ